MDWMFVLHVARIVKESISITLFPLRMREIQLSGADLRPPRLAPGPPPRAAPEGRLQVPRLGQSVFRAEYRVADIKTFLQSDCRSQDDERKAGTELKRRKERKDKEIDEGSTAASSRPGKGMQPTKQILIITAFIFT